MQNSEKKLFFVCTSPKVSSLNFLTYMWQLFFNMISQVTF
jgi:hypothetical protein